MSDNDKLDSILAAVTELKHDIRGNGRPGLLDRMTTIEVQQNSCPAREAFKGESRRQSWGLMIASGALILSAIAMWIK